MRPGVIEMANVVGEHGERMALAQDDDVIETLASHAAEDAFTSRVHVGRTHGGLDDPRSEGLGSEIEFGAELAVPIADDERGPAAERRSIAELLRRPLLGGSPRYRDVHDFARPDIDDEKGEDGPEPHAQMSWAWFSRNVAHQPRPSGQRAHPAWNTSGPCAWRLEFRA
jgi:hypothetical protein